MTTPDWHGKMMDCDRCAKIERHNRRMIAIDLVYIFTFVGALFVMLVWR